VSHHRDVVMRACQRFERCSANICPVDPDWRARRHLDGEPACYFLLEAVKDGAEARFQARSIEETRAAVLRVLPDMVSTVGAIRRAVESARRTGSRMDRQAPVRRAA
jgi:hypothetical protein